MTTKTAALMKETTEAGENPIIERIYLVMMGFTARYGRLTTRIRDPVPCSRGSHPGFRSVCAIAG